MAREAIKKNRDYPTLQHVVGFVQDRAGAPATAPADPAPAETAPEADAAPAAAAPVAEPVVAAKPAPSPAASGPTSEEIPAAVLDVVAAQTGYPADMLDPDLDLEADLGIDTV